MAGKDASLAAEPLLPVELGPGKVKFAQGIRAGRWVFATGLMAQDFATGIAADVLAERTPHAGRPKREKETARIFANLDAVLRAAGTDPAHLVRTDQYYTTVKAVPPYQQVRREVLAGRIPPSTSIAQQRLLLPGADMNIQAMGIIPGDGFEVQHLKHEQLQGRPTSGYSPALTAGDFIFIPGITSLAVGDEPRRNGVAEEALMTRGRAMGRSADQARDRVHHHQAHGAVAGAGGRQARGRGPCPGLSHRPRGLFGLQRDMDQALRCIGAELFDHPVHRPRPGALRRQDRDQHHRGETRQRGEPAPVDAGVVTAFRHQPQAVRAGDLLFISGLMAIDRAGLVDGAAADPRQPWFSSSPEAQAECIIDNIAKICEAAGTSLANVVRVLQFHTDIGEFYPVYKVWERQLDGRPVPFSAVEVPGPLPVPGATVQIEAWVYAP